MTITLNLTSEIPIYLQIKNAVITSIAAGNLKPGEMLPSVRQLAADIGVNMQTVNKAYTLLKQEEYIQINRRSGAVVMPKRDTADAQFKQRLEQDIAVFAASARTKGMEKWDFLVLCEKAYRKAAGMESEDST